MRLEECYLRIACLPIRWCDRMDTKDLKPFQELHHTDKLLRLDGFGGVKWNINEHDNPLVECIFTPIELPNPAVEPKPKLKLNDQFMAGIAVGYLPTLFPGQCFRNGKRLPTSQWLPVETITFDLDTLSPGAVMECTLPDLQLDLRSAFIADSFESTANRAGLKKLHGVLQKTSNKKFWKLPITQDVFIHEMELIRFYLTNSSHSCKNIFNGAFSAQQLATQVVNELHEKKSLDPQTLAGRFVYRHGYQGVDAPALGRILLDPTQTALKAAQRVHSKIVADRLNSEEDWIGYPRTYFPFEGKTRLSLSGRRLRTATGYIFFAYRIHSCSAPFPFKSLSFCDEIEPGGNPAPPDAPTAFPGSNAVTTGPAHEETGDAQIGESKSNEPPKSNSVLLQTELGERRYLWLDNVEIRREKRRDSTYRSEKKTHRYLDELKNASTGAGTTGDSTSTRQSVNEKIVVPSAVTADLHAFIAAISKLQKIHKKWKIATVGVGSDSDNELTSYFPEVPCEKMKDTKRAFSFTDEEKHKRRRFICIQVNVDGCYLYVFEAQRRLRNPVPPPGTSPYKEALPILLLHTPGYEEVQGGDFLDVMTETVIKKTWPNNEGLGMFIRDHLIHGQGEQSVDDLCERVEQLVKRNA